MRQHTNCEVIHYATFSSLLLLPAAQAKISSTAYCQITKPFLCNSIILLLSLGSKYSPQHPNFRHPQVMFFAYSDRTNRT